MSEQMNSKEDQQKAAMQHLVNYLTTPLMIVVRGCVAIANNINPEVVLIASCHAFASVIGMSYGGDEEGVKKLREACRVAFSGTLHQVPITPINNPAPAAELDNSLQEQSAETFGRKEEARPDA